jgi:hypothetical protein
MNTDLAPLPAFISSQQLARTDDLDLLELHQQALQQHNEPLDGLIQAEVVRRIKFDLLGSVLLYNAFASAFENRAA